MFDFRLKVFYTVARRLNFTKAAEELFITQPAVTKHIHEIETYYKTRLFQRNGTKIKLTSAGTALLEHAEQLFDIYRNIEFDLAAINENVKGTIRIGASTTVAQYVLPKYLASFKQKFPDTKIELTANNTEHIENALIANKIDFGIIEGQSKRPQLKYTTFLKDEMVLCTRTGNPVIKKQSISLASLKELPLLIREQGSGSQEVIATALKKAGIKVSQLKIEMVLDSTESIKSYLSSSDCFAFLSVHSILKELKSNELTIIDIKDLSIERSFYFVIQQGDKHHLSELFIKFISADNFKL
ncbi:LysR family transcriptional regulator [Niastella caeni]|uniref:LysR family transcriptional regulator n=1 Tax=Niastella caeni TaxID=2569763 RepID=A0A4S8HWN6_9BACT|nr:LysR family transcriptional regulator [Niastella caeni]THU39159.1 LysR family transcriptional regulator [Niastella caeni]